MKCTWKGTNRHLKLSLAFAFLLYFLMGMFLKYATYLSMLVNRTKQNQVVRDCIINSISNAVTQQ